MDTGSASKTERHNREDIPDALHQVLFAWGKRLFGGSVASQAPMELPDDMMLSGKTVRVGPVSLANVSLSNWQQQTMTQLMHALMLTLTKHGRDTDASYVVHLQQITREGEIDYEECLDRLQRLCPDEMNELPSSIRAKLACIKHGIH